MADLTTGDINRMKEFLAVTREDILRWLPAAWEPGWLSEAASEIGNDEVGTNGPWGERPVRTAYAAAQVFLYATVDTLEALADSVNVQTTTYVPHVLARAAMEAGSQAWWLMEPRLGARRRVIRSILIRASSARYLGKAARKMGRAAIDYGEDQAMVREYAQGLGLIYVCNDDIVRCEIDTLPSYTKRGADFEKAVFMTAAYAIYSGAAHAEFYAVCQGWRQSAVAAPLWERAPDRMAVWAAVVAAAGFATVPAFRVIEVLGLNARRVEVAHSMRKIGQMMREMNLPREWWY